MTENANPTRNIANYDELSGALNEVFGKFLNSLDDMLPAIVESYDVETNRVKVRPAIRVIDTTGTETQRASIASIPVFQMGAGGFMLHVKPREGDFGWIKANDRDIALFLENYAETPPNTFRKHKFSDAVFFPDVMRGYDSGSTEDGILLQTLDGTTRIALQEAAISMTVDDTTITMSDENVDIQSNAEVNITSGTVNIIADGEEGTTVNITGKVALGGMGGMPIARQGDPVVAGGMTGTITTGSMNHTAT